MRRALAGVVRVMLRVTMTTLWPTLTVTDVDASLAFYSDKLGFTSDLRLQDRDGRTFLGSVEVGDTVIMLESPDPRDPPDAQRGARSGVRLTICFAEDHDLDAYYAQLRSKDVFIVRNRRQVLGQPRLYGGRPRWLPFGSREAGPSVTLTCAVLNVA